MKQFCLRSFFILLCLTTSMLLFACVHAGLTLTTGQARPPIAPEEVKIYENAGKVPGKYEEVGIINARGDYVDTDLADMYKAMRQEAAKYGANGVILGAVDEPETSGRIIRSITGYGGDRAGKATAIYVFPEKLP